MDATVRPLRIPPEMAIYAEKHDIFHLVQVQTVNKTIFMFYEGNLNQINETFADTSEKFDGGQTRGPHSTPD